MDNQVFNTNNDVYNIEEPKCPHCGIDISTTPLKKTICFSCKRPYYIKKHPMTGVYQIVGKAKMLEWQKERKLYNLVKDLEPYGIDPSEFYELKENTKRPLRDIVWSLFNKSLYLNAANSTAKKAIYFSMAHFVHEEGRDPSMFIRLHNEVQLLEIECSSIKLNVKIIIGNIKDCSNCKHLEDKLMTLKEAYEENVLPYQPCNRAFCIASYGTVPVRDDNGRIVRNY